MTFEIREKFLDENGDLKKPYNQVWKESPYVACRVEGCPRAFAEGQEEACGLWKLRIQPPISPKGTDPTSVICGAEATVLAWEQDGLWEGL
jgi:hypothetical protein